MPQLDSQRELDICTLHRGEASGVCRTISDVCDLSSLNKRFIASGGHRLGERGNLDRRAASSDEQQAARRPHPTRLRTAQLKRARPVFPGNDS